METLNLQLGQDGAPYDVVLRDYFMVKGYNLLNKLIRRSGFRRFNLSASPDSAEASGT